jgi:tetratricopeptide (TPR) repeat protein
MIILFNTLLEWMALGASVALAEQITNITEPLEEAILAEKWEKVVRLLSDVNEPNLPASLRLIKGHACLATNRNNESLCLFLNSSSQADLLEWKEWTNSFTVKHLTSPIAYYFKGDSNARLRQWDQATANLNTACVIEPNHALVLNARAVFFAHRGMMERARADIEKTLKITQGRLADAWANLGYYWIQRQEGAEGAIRAFGKAIELSPNFALAFHGRGCANLVLGKQEAKYDLAKATEYGSCATDVMAANYTQYALFYSIRAGGGDPRQLLAEIQSPGTTLERRYGYNDLGKSATNWFNAGDIAKNTLGDMKWLPFNQHIGNALDNFCSNRGAERLYTMNERYGPGSVQSWGKNNMDITPKAYGTFTKIDPTNKTADAIGSGLISIGTSIGVNSAYRPGGIGDNLLQAGVGGGLFASGVGIKSSANKWNSAIPQLKDALQPILSFNSVNLTAPGGVRIDFRQVRWDDGDWPFVALYALAYRSDVNTPGEVGIEGGAK